MDSPGIVIVDKKMGRDGFIESTSLINIRPGQGNRSMEITSTEIRQRVRELTDLTVEVTSSRGLRRELLRWRDLVAAM